MKEYIGACANTASGTSANNIFLFISTAKAQGKPDKGPQQKENNHNNHNDKATAL